MFQRIFTILVIVAATAFAGCNRPAQPRTDDDGRAKQEWQSTRAPQELDQLRNRLTHSQNDR